MGLVLKQSTNALANNEIFLNNRSYRPNEIIGEIYVLVAIHETNKQQWIDRTARAVAA